MMGALPFFRHLLFLRLHFWIPRSWFCSKALHVFLKRSNHPFEVGNSVTALRLSIGPWFGIYCDMKTRREPLLGYDTINT
jgi:hypothetical protein